MPITTSGSSTTAQYDSAFSITGYSGKLPITIQNMPEEQSGAVYSSGDGSFTMISYAKEKPPAALSAA